MKIVLLQTQLRDEEIHQLSNEFPLYEFRSLPESSGQKLSKEDWEKVIVFFGSSLTVEELKMAKRLHWVHCSGAILNALCLEEIKKTGKIVLTCTPEENSSQIAEFVMTAALAFMKNLFFWDRTERDPSARWSSKLPDTMLELKNKIFLQVGLGAVGTEITSLAKTLGLQTWGVHETPTFHPNCQKTFSYDNWHEALPSADIVSVAFRRCLQKENLFDKEKLELMKDDSILIIAGSKNIVDEAALIQVADSGKFRGVFLDLFHELPVSKDSKLWEISNVIITPEIAPQPKTTEREAYWLFLYNLRQYHQCSFTSMQNHITNIPECPC